MDPLLLVPVRDAKETTWIEERGVGTIPGAQDLRWIPCGYTEGRVTLDKIYNYIVVKVNVSGTTLYVTGNHVMY